MSTAINPPPNQESIGRDVKERTHITHTVTSGSPLTLNLLFLLHPNKRTIVFFGHCIPKQLFFFGTLYTEGIGCPHNVASFRAAREGTCLGKIRAPFDTSMHILFFFACLWS